jgi:hypothetical protein
MSRVENLHEVMDSTWCDKVVLLQNKVAGPKATINMLRAAKDLGLRVVIEYDLSYHPKGGDYVSGVAGPRAYLGTQGSEVCIASDWEQLFRWVRNARRRRGNAQHRGTGM